MRKKFSHSSRLARGSRDSFPDMVNKIFRIRIMLNNQPKSFFQITFKLVEPSLLKCKFLSNALSKVYSESLLGKFTRESPCCMTSSISGFPFDLGIPDILDIPHIPHIPEIFDLGIFAHFFLVVVSAHFGPIPPSPILLSLYLQV